MTEFVPTSWLMILFLELLMLFGLATFIHILISSGVEKGFKNKKPTWMFALECSFNIAYRALINKGTQYEFKSQSYKMFLTTLMFLGLVILSYYKAQMNAALNVEVDNIPFKTWSDVEQSDYGLLVWIGGVSEEPFKNAENESIMNKIYEQKIVPLKDHGTHLSDTGFMGSVPNLLKGKFLAFENLRSFSYSDDYPCKITSIKSFELMQNFYQALPFAKESPFLEPMKRTLFELSESGIIRKIWDHHHVKLDAKCEEAKVQISTQYGK